MAILKDVTRGYITIPRSCTTLRETIMATLKDVTRVHYQGPVEFYIVCNIL
jgi:hypothetical protein